MQNIFRYSALLLLIGLPLARATELSIRELTTVSSTVHNGYQREKLPDGSFKPITYVFGEGECVPGSVADRSLDRVKFGPLARSLSAPLAKLGYQPARDSHKIDQLLAVSWGRTIGWDSSGYGDAYGTLNTTFDTMKSAFPDSLRMPPGNFGPGQSSPPTRGLGGTPGAANDMDNMMWRLSVQDDARNRTNLRNAQLLGYYETLRHTPTFFGNLVSTRREELLDDLEDDRYYVILVAYDFPTTLQNRKPKVLWITRFSLRARGNDFDQNINRMIGTAASYFGRSSDGLRREQIPEGYVKTGELKVLDKEEPK
jgi:hypothetical protein